MNLYFNLVIYDLQKTFIDPKNVVNIPAKFSPGSSRGMPTYLSIKGPIFEIRNSQKQLSKSTSDKGKDYYVNNFVKIH